MSDNLRDRDVDAEELERQRRRKARLQRMKQEKARQMRIQRILKVAIPAAVVVLALLIGGIVAIVRGASKAGAEKVAEKTQQTAEAQEAAGSAKGKNKKTEQAVLLEGLPQTAADLLTAGLAGFDIYEGAFYQDGKKIYTPVVSTKQYSAQETARTAAPPGEVDSKSAILIDLASGEILVNRDCHAVINPASMTKVLTVLVAAEHIQDLDDTFVITQEITDYSYVHQCSNTGFAVGEEVTVRDLFYGTILPSGADAAVGLATYVAGSHEAFVDMMNEKLEILGLSDTAHFTNCVGLYDTNHHCSIYDMAMIMEAALENDICREVLSAHTYTTSSTEQHPEGITVSNWFLRRIEDKDTGGEVICAKTGFVAQSGNCAVSYGVDASGKEYVCATGGAHSSWRCIYDHVAIYKAYAQSGGE
ncbi:MAG: D-alanyl-D-alanine carboxypeptidase [Lachnospiraceae bacterium]|nr:D-alanyl-D-alanine carboxypeptidase [Lachnospiraceae bacterium]